MSSSPPLPTVLSKPNPPVARQDLRSALLNSSKPHSTTAFALKMIEQLRQSRELLSTPGSEAAIKLLLMDGRSKVLIQPTKSREVTVAEIALVGVAIPRTISSNICDALIRATVGEKAGRVCDNVTSVVLTDDAIDCSAVYARTAGA